MFKNDHSTIEIGTADGQEKAAANTSPNSIETNLDWQRIEALAPQINVVARHWTSRTGQDVEDIEQIITLVIAEQALRDPDFLRQKDSFVLALGSWRFTDVLRRQWRDDTAAVLDDELPVSSEEMCEARNLDDILPALSPPSRALLRTIVAAGDTVLKRNGSLNVSALARRLGLSNSTARRQVERLRQELVVAGYGL